MSRRKNQYAKPDRFTRAAKDAGFPARSVFKLEEIDRRTRLLRGGMRILDLGAAPGSWSLYAAKRIGPSGRLLAVDLVPIVIALPPHATSLVADAFSIDDVAAGQFAPYDVVLSDMAPNTTGNRATDQARSFDLFMRALDVAARLGAPGGAFVGKIFMSDDLPVARAELRRHYASERLIRPEGTRAVSTEILRGRHGEAAMSMKASQLLAGRFSIEREVGRGGVGVVYRAFDQMSKQAVALKVIALPGVDGGEEARFRREGRVLAGLHHPNIVRVVAFGQLDEGQPYIAMEWLEGEDIAQRQRRSPLSLAQSVLVASEVGEALAAAHEAGIVHRDVEAVERVSGGGERRAAGGPFEVKLVDFGVASVEDAKLTRTGAIVGTPAYMAPEQARGDSEIDGRSDLYALGATLFDMITGRPPHVGPTPIAILARLVTTPAPRLAEVLVGVPPRLDDLVARPPRDVSSERPESASDVALRRRELAEEMGSTSSDRLTRGHRQTTDNALIWRRGRQAAAAARDVDRGDLRAQGAFTRAAPDASAVTGSRRDGARRRRDRRAPRGPQGARGRRRVGRLDLGLRIAKAPARPSGIATGRTRIDRARPTGEVVDRAAALARDAARGQVLADTSTTELARGRFELQLRGDGSAIVGIALRGRREFVGGAPFVGREAELAQIVAAFERCVDDKTPIVVTVTGAPGIGKTRLRREALSRIASHAGAPRIVLARCEPFAKAQALGVVGDVARALTGVSKGASLQDAFDATDVLIAVSEAQCSEYARDLLARLIANEVLPELDDARGARDALWLLLTDVAAGLMLHNPLVLGLEDAQWADADSLSWLDHLLARAAGRPLFVFAATRPTFWRESAARFAGRDHVRIELRPLSRKQARSIASSLLGERALGAEGEALVDSIAQQSAGLPLFAEELARVASVGRDASDAPTIEAAMQVHLDALDELGRDAASKLAVFGQVGWDAGLEAVGVPSAADVLRELAAAEILVEQAHARFAGTREFAFKHALMREVAYASLGEEALQEFHARAGRWAGEGRRGRRDRGTAPRARWARRHGGGVSREGGAARAGGARAARGGLAGRAGARVRGGQADAVRAGAAPRRSVEPPRRAGAGEPGHPRCARWRTPFTTRRAR